MAHDLPRTPSGKHRIISAEDDGRIFLPVNGAPSWKALIGIFGGAIVAGAAAVWCLMGLRVDVLAQARADDLRAQTQIDKSQDERIDRAVQYAKETHDDTREIKQALKVFFRDKRMPEAASKLRDTPDGGIDGGH